jgi:hypothetical protein
VPLVSAQAGTPIDVIVTSNDLVAYGQVELFYRRTGARDWRSLGFGQQENGDWVATIPRDEVLSGALEYRIVSTEEGGIPVARFATDTEPQRITVTGDSRASTYERELARYDGQTSRASVEYRMDNFGENEGMPDNMWGVTTDFTFRVLGTLHALRFGVSRMRAETVVEQTTDEEELERTPPMGWTPTEPGEDVVLVAESTGYDSGFAELQFALHDYFGLKAQVQLGANLTRFTAGYRAEVRLGLEPGTHVKLYGGGAGDIGFVAGMGLHWDTVPKIPMSTAVEVTNWPSGEQVALRLITEAELPVGDRFDLNIKGTYQGRTALLGGFGGGLGCSYSF